MKNGQQGRRTPNPTTCKGKNSEKGRIIVEGAPVGAAGEEIRRVLAGIQQEEQPGGSGPLLSISHAGNR